MEKNRSVKQVDREWGLGCSFKVGAQGQPHQKVSLSKHVEEEREETVQMSWKGVPGRGSSKCKGPEVGTAGRPRW